MKRTIGFALAVALLLSMLMAPEARSADGGATPEAVFDNFKAAMKDKDFKKGFQQTTPDSQDLVLGGIAIGMSFMQYPDAAQGQEANSLLEKHGVKKPDLNNPAAMQDPKALMKGMVADVKDKPAAIAELMAFMEKSVPADAQQNASTQADAFATATLEDVKVEGDSATGNVKMAAGDQAGSKPIMFKKVGGVWYLDFAALTEKAMQGQGGAGAMPK